MKNPNVSNVHKIGSVAGFLSLAAMFFPGAVNEIPSSTVVSPLDTPASECPLSHVSFYIVNQGDEVERLSVESDGVVTVDVNGSVDAVTLDKNAPGGAYVCEIAPGYVFNLSPEEYANLVARNTLVNHNNGSVGYQIDSTVFQLEPYDTDVFKMPTDRE